MSNETPLDLDAAMKLVEKHATVAVSGSPFMSSWHAEGVAFARADFRRTATPEVVLGIINQRDAAIARAEAAEAAHRALLERVDFLKAQTREQSQRLAQVTVEHNAAEVKVALMRESLTNYPETCDKYPDPSESFCGWRSAVRSLRTALAGEDA